MFFLWVCLVLGLGFDEMHVSMIFCLFHVCTYVKGRDLVIWSGYSGLAWRGVGESFVSCLKGVFEIHIFLCNKKARTAYCRKRLRLHRLYSS